jgi:hypothetical protein
MRKSVHLVGFVIRIYIAYFEVEASVNAEHNA